MSNAAIQLKNLGVLPGLGLKGPGVVEWLQSQSTVVPHAIFEALPLSNGAWIARLGKTEFFIQSPSDDDLLQTLCAGALGPFSATYPIPRSDATFLLGGTDARSVFAQTCAVDFRDVAPQRVILSRVAGVTCGILPELAGSELSFRIWAELSYAQYLWETLEEIVSDLGGTTSHKREVPRSSRTLAPA